MLDESGIRSSSPVRAATGRAAGSRPAVWKVQIRGYVWRRKNAAAEERRLRRPRAAIRSSGQRWRGRGAGTGGMRCWQGFRTLKQGLGWGGRGPTALLICVDAAAPAAAAEATVTASRITPDRKRLRTL